MASRREILLSLSGPLCFLRSKLKSLFIDRYRLENGVLCIVFRRSPFFLYFAHLSSRNWQ
jgi:hypothetical protein